MKKMLILIALLTSLLIFDFYYFKVEAAESEITPTYTNIYVYTPNSTQVAAIRYDYDMSDEDKNSIIEEYVDYEIIGDPTWYYNCHSYAWYFNGTLLPTSSSDSCWINDPSNYISDNSYEEITMNYISEGDIVTYWNNGNLSHSGLVTTDSGIINVSSIEKVYVISKFGNGPLIRHSLTNADSYYKEGTEIKFYTRHEHCVISYTSISATKHSGICDSCGETITDEHNIYTEGLFYKCTQCNYKETFIPIIKNGVTYYLFAGDPTQTLRTENELVLYLVQNNYVSLINDINVISES